MPERERTVLHVLPHPGGGGETYVDLLEGMEGYRFERVYLAPGPEPRGARARILANALSVQRAAFRADLVHVIGEVAGALCLLVLAARPSVFSPQGLSLVRRVDGAARRAARINLRLITGLATGTICASEMEYRDLVALGGRQAARRAVVVRNGVPTREPVSNERRSTLRSELALSPSELVGCWLGTLDSNKDPLTAIEAARKARREGVPVKLLMAGDGPLREEVEVSARQADDAVRVLGHREDVDRILGASDFFVLSSRREGLSFSLLEAMSHGLAPIVSDAPANVEAVGEAGIVVPFADTARFAEALSRLGRDPEARKTLGEQARHRVARCFSLDEALERTRTLYDGVVRDAER